MTLNSTAHTIKDTACLWVARMTSGAIDADTERQFAEWIAQDPQHQLAYQQAWLLWVQLGELALQPDYPFQRQRNSLQRRRGAWKFLATAASAVFLLLSWPELSLHWQADFITVAGENKTVQLADGSRVYLNTHSAIAVEYSEQFRRIRLLKGEAEFEVRKNPLKPFIVEADQNTVTALGTDFIVRHEQDWLSVTMLENRVEITVANQTAPLILNPGEQLNYQQDFQQPSIQRVDLHKLSAWRRGKLIFESTPLKTVIAEVNRYRPGLLMLLGDDHAQLPVSGVFDLQQLDRLIGVIEQTLNVKTQHLGEQLVLIY